MSVYHAEMNGRDDCLRSSLTLERQLASNSDVSDVRHS